MKTSPRTRSARRQAAVWTAGSPSATTAVRSATSSPTGTTSPTGVCGTTRSTGCTPPTISPSSLDGSARRRVSRRVFLAFTSRPSRSNGSRSRSSTARSPKVGSCRCQLPPRRARRSPWSAPAPLDLRSPSSSPAPGTMWSSTSALTASVVCCATASPNSRWRSVTSTVASSKWRPRGRCSAPT